MDWVELDRFRVDCVVGLLAAEQTTAQPVEIEVGLGLDLDAAGDMDDLGNSVDYGAVCDELTFLAKAGRFRLLETFGLAVLRHLLSAPAPGEGRRPLEAARVALRKPSILGGRAVPGVKMERDAKWRKVAARVLAEGVVADVFVETIDGGVYRVLLAKEARFTVPRPVELRVLAGHVATEADSLEPGEQASWSGAQALVAGEDGAALLLVSRPPLKP